MTRKSKIVTLCLLGVVASLGACMCCTSWMDWQEKNDPAAQHGGHVVRTRPFFFFWGRSYMYSAPTGGGVAGGTSSATSRGGFGATGAAAASGGHASGAGA